MFVERLRISMYVDDVIAGTNNQEETYELYRKSKLRLQKRDSS
jgi:hypothetical protein